MIAPQPESFHEAWDRLPSDAALARHYRAGLADIRRWREELGLPAKTREPAPAAFRAGWATGDSDRALGRSFGVSPSIVRRWRRELDLPPNVPGQCSQWHPGVDVETQERRRVHSARVERGRRARVERTRENGGVAPIEAHGASTYRNWGCRCETCRAAMRTQNHERHVYEQRRLTLTS